MCVIKRAKFNSMLHSIRIAHNKYNNILEFILRFLYNIFLVIPV
jgi:hypothetical protein